MNDQHQAEIHGAVATSSPRQIDRMRQELARLLQDPRVAEQDKEALRRDPLLQELSGLELCEGVADDS